MVLRHLRDFFHLGRDRDSSSTGDGGSLPRHFGDLWTEVQKLAEEENPGVFSRKSVAEHAGESLEGKKDVDRWLHAFMKRVDPDHEFRFPDHHPRHRGACLIVRQYPSGTRWEAFDEDTLLRLPVEAEASEDALRQALDAHLDAGPDAEPDTDGSGSSLRE